MDDLDEIWGLGENSLIKIEDIITDLLTNAAEEEQTPVEEDKTK